MAPRKTAVPQETAVPQAAAGSQEAAGRQRGRPRRYASNQARYREHGRRRGERAALVNALLHAVRNAHWEERELHQRIQAGDDEAVLTALIAYYRARHWQRREGAALPEPDE